VKPAYPYFLFVAALHVAGIFLLLPYAASHPALVGAGLLAYTLGLRHAFDVDHIAAIDNIVRKLVQRRSDALGVGFFFSLGHSTVVCIMATGVAFVASWASALPSLRLVGGILGTAISGSILLLIGIVNLVIWFDILGSLRRSRAGANLRDQAHAAAVPGGIVSKLAAPLFRLIDDEKQAYPIGFLFGLGFDTASEVALLALAAGAAATALPVPGVLALPILFAAGMTMMDTADGVFMVRAYNWAFSAPLRKLHYNLTLTGISVVAALLIGSMELASLAGGSALSGSTLWSRLQQVDFSVLGLILIGVCGLTWAVSYGARRFTRS
jgi:high-affinity nickel-transport protein